MQPRKTLLLACCCSLLSLPLAGCTMPSPQEQAKANEVYLAKEGITALAPGSPAPPLGALDDQGQPVELASLLGRHARGVVLFFVPAAGTPNSERNLRDWQQRRAKLAEQGLGVYAVVPGDVAAAAAFAAQAGLELPLLADPAGDIARAWGCLAPAGKYPQRTSIGIDAGGKIVLFYRGQADQRSLDAAFGLDKSDN